MVELVVDGLSDADGKSNKQHEGQRKSATGEREHGTERFRLTTGMPYNGGEMAARAVLLIVLIVLIVVANSDNLYLYCIRYLVALRPAASGVP